MDLSKLSRSEIVGVLAGVILVVALFFLNWYSLDHNPLRDHGQGFICGKDQYQCTGFETFPILRWLLILAAAAPLILAWIVIRGHKLSWAPGELTMVIGFTAFVLIAYNGIIDRPGSQPAGDRDLARDRLLDRAARRGGHRRRRASRARWRPRRATCARPPAPSSTAAALGGGPVGCRHGSDLTGRALGHQA